jgi:antitoxin component YwqK of YwqJK toxin-antitoxin module
MKLPYVLAVLGVSGLLISFLAFRGGRADAAAGDVQTTFYANGQVQSQTAFVDGKREGTSTRFYADGKKMAEGSYSAGKMEGDWIFWRPDGARDAERSGTYRAGEKQGVPSVANAAE